MTWTELREKIKKMRFEEAYGGWLKKELTQEQAACLLGVSVRTFRRYIVNGHFFDPFSANKIDPPQLTILHFCL